MKRQAYTLRERGHRPWPVPERPWFMAQTWEDLLFAHWRVPGEALAEVMPRHVPLDSFDGSAWIGVTPFEVSAFRLRGTVPVPPISRFAETNVRTYVTVGGRPGIWFFSLDAASRFAVRGARLTYRLPYFRSEMEIDRGPEWIDYRARRVSADGPPAELDVRYRTTRPAANPAPGSLEHFLTERYCLYTLDGEGRFLRGDIHHPPWPLQPAEAEIARNTMGDQIGVELTGEPLLHFAARQDVVFWRLARAA